ncbi:MAG: LysR substrate-binding domain-containing protein [Steroidobacteraceae bacterium]
MKRDLARRLKLHHLRIIAAISSKGSLLKASAALGLTQPALTRALHEMEMIIGARLFERHAKGMVPNQLGKLMSESALRVLADLNSLEREIDTRISSEAESIAIGALPSAAVGILPGVVARLQKDHPSLRVRIVQGQTEEMITALSNGAVDVVIGRLYPPVAPDNLERVELYQDTVALLARADHPIFLQQPLSLESLAKYELALTAKTPYAATEIEQLIQRLKLQQATYLESNSLPLIRELLLATDMITLVPRLMMAGDILRGAVREVTSLPVSGGRPYGLITRRDTKQSRSTEIFIKLLREYVQHLVVQGVAV